MVPSEYLTWRKEGLRDVDGVLVASDIGSEWMLPWWWERYSKHNSAPVAFVDFGMSEEMKEWCREKGEFIRLRVADVFVVEQEEVDRTLALDWEKTFGKEFWNCRRAWFKKPLACLQSPFRRTLWLDLDCEVRGSIAPLFTFADSPAGFSLQKRLQPQRDPIYNSGVIPFRRGIPFFETWANECLAKTDQFRGDQEVLSHLIAKEQLPIEALPLNMHWFFCHGENPDALIVHWLGTGHRYIRSQIAGKNLLFETPQKNNNTLFTNNFQT